MDLVGDDASVDEVEDGAKVGADGGVGGMEDVGKTVDGVAVGARCCRSGRRGDGLANVARKVVGLVVGDGGRVEAERRVRESVEIVDGGNVVVSN